MYVRLALIFLVIGCSSKTASDRLVIINGRSHHILDLGSGDPVVVFVPGFGDDLDSYKQVQQALSETTRTISYDRAGLGKSDLTSNNRSLDTLVKELNTILAQEDIAAPYILVGHSFGGHIVRYFAHVHPEKVAGIVLIDPSVEDLDAEIRKVKTPAEVKSYDSLYEHGRDPSWPEGVKREAEYFRSNEKLMEGVEFTDNIPVTLITAMNMPESSLPFLKGASQIKIDLHKRWVTQSPHIRHVFAQKSGHYVHYDEKDLVINEIKAMASR